MTPTAYVEDLLTAVASPRAETPETPVTPNPDENPQRETDPETPPQPDPDTTPDTDDPETDPEESPGPGSEDE